ncbi:MAG: metal-dependent hydrolase [Candidatus Odinarchaeota archaeon]
MDFFTHMFMGILAGLFSLTKLIPEAIILMWIMTFLPDFDVLLEPLQKIRKMYYLSHKAGSHSYIVGLIFTGIVSLIISIFRNVLFIEIWFAGFIGYSIHVSLDLFAASKIPIFYPISKKEYRFIADRAVNPILMVFSCINILVLSIVYFTLPYYQILMNFALFYLYVYLIYFVIRAFLRLTIQMRIPKNQKYIPGLLPYYYFIYEKNSTIESTTFNLSKQFVFSSKKQNLINQTILNLSDDFPFFKLAKQISEEYRFYHKWNYIIPFIFKNQDSVNVVLILAESFSQSVRHKSIKRERSSYYISIIFNKSTKQLISKTEGFGSFKNWQNSNW